MTGIDGDKDGAAWDGAHDEPLETEQLALADEEERLPWLESSDDDADEDYEGSELGATLRLALMALIALGVIVGGIYWVTHRNPDPALVADGSLVPADSRPYKEAPKDPGGKTFDGTSEPAKKLAAAGLTANDVKAAALGAHHLSGLGVDGTLAYLNLGTGLAAAVVHAGEVVRGIDGVAGEIIYPTVGMVLCNHSDFDFKKACFEAYNRWLQEYCAVAPDRLYGMAQVSMRTPEDGVKEIRAAHAMGFRGVMMRPNPIRGRGLDSPHWDPLWTALSDEGVVLSIHLGSSGKLAMTAPDAPVDVMITLQPMNIQSAAADLLWSRVLKTYPDLRIALSEGGIGWVPYFLDRVDRTFEMHRAWTQQDFGGRLPSEVFREHFLTCFISDDLGIGLRDRIGVETMVRAVNVENGSNSGFSRPAGGTHGVMRPAFAASCAASGRSISAQPGQRVACSQRRIPIPVTPRAYLPPTRPVAHIHGGEQRLRRS